MGAWQTSDHLAAKNADQKIHTSLLLVFFVTFVPLW